MIKFISRLIKAKYNQEETYKETLGSEMRAIELAKMWQKHRELLEEVVEIELHRFIVDHARNGEDAEFARKVMKYQNKFIEGCYGEMRHKLEKEDEPINKKKERRIKPY